MLRPLHRPGSDHRRIGRQHDAPIYLSGVGTVVRTCNRHFPGTDSEISEQMALDVAEDEKAIIVK